MLLLVFVIIPSNILPPKITYATDLNEWLTSISSIANKTKFYHFKYKDESTTYNAYFMSVKLPEQTSSYPRIVYKYSTSGSISFIYQEKVDGKIVESPVKLNLEVIEDETTNRRRSILKRQAANNFNTSDDKFGYLLEVAGNIEAYEGKRIVFSAQIGEGSTAEKKEITVLPTGWSESTYFTNKDQNSGTAWWEVVIAWISDALNEVKNLLEDLLTDVFLALADGILAAICAAVGEPVTMDKVIFGEVGKLSINFWNDPNMPAASANSVMSVMSNVVNAWYNVFLMIAIIVYLAALLFTGLKIVLASTGDSKAKYKDTLQAWLSGVMILFLFPYVMKYTVTLNNALIQMINTDFSVTEVDETPDVSEGKLDSLSDTFGDADFIESFRGTTDPNADPKKDIMVYVRKLAGDLGSMALTFVYFVLLGELIVIIVVYYKRVFMMAFLITIFPIVAIFYIIEKMGSGSSRALSTWMKEYMVLVFTQAFHAAVYVVVVNAGVQSYIESDNWLFMLMCVIFLFQGEKILRSIFGMKSSANTIGDLATAGMVAYGLATSASKVFKRDKTDPADKAEEKEIAEAKQKSKPLADGSGTNVPDSARNAAREASESDGRDDDGEEDSTSEDPKTPQDITNDSNANFSKASSAVIAKALGNRKKGRGKGIIGKVGNTVLNVTGGTVGATLGVAAGLAQGDLGKAATYAVAGKEMGKGVMAPARAVVRGVSNAYHGRKLKRKIMKGEMDKDFKKLGFDLGSMESEKQAIFREALANLAQTTTTGGKAKGELRMLNTMSKEDRKKK